MDTYEKKYNEALNWMRELYPGLHGATKEDAEHYFPELKESEDERIRKWLIDYFTNVSKSWIHRDISPNEILDYLERQKDLFESGRGLYYYDGEKTTYCGYPATEENPYDFAMSQQEKQKEQKPVQSDDEKAYIRTIKSIISDFIRDKKPEGVAYYQRIYDWLDGRHIEQKPADEQFPPLEGLDAIKAKYYDDGFKNGFDEGVESVKPAEWDDYTKTNLDRALQIIRDAKGTLQGYQSDDGIYECDKAIECIEHFLYRGLEIEKPAEWSEEDEDMLNCCISSIEEAKENRYAYKETDGDTSYDREIAWLKSLRPQSHWKPSEEQMKHLERCFSHGHTSQLPNQHILESLYNELKKLM